MEFLDKVIAMIGSLGGASATIAVVLEFVLRILPSQKPLSILHLIGACAKKIGAIAMAIGDLLDKVLPQNVVESKKA